MDLMDNTRTPASMMSIKSIVSRGSTLPPCNPLPERKGCRAVMNCHNHSERENHARTY